MSRNLLGSAITYLENTSQVRIAHLVKIELAESIDGDTFSYVTDYLSDITWAGKTYEAGKIVKVGDITQTLGFVNYKVNVDIAGEYQEELDKGLSSYNTKSYIGNKVEILRAFIDTDGSIIPFDKDTNGPMAYFTGEISDIDIKEDVTKGASTVSWKCVGAFADLNLVNGRLTEDKSHRGLELDNLGSESPSDSAKRAAYQTDTGFQHATRTIETTAIYTVTEKRYKMKSSWGGFKSKLKEYEVEVEKELELGISLSARYLPVVYGVRKVSGIPIFVDQPSNNASLLYVVYAFCEGEIESFLDFYVDGKPSICTTAQDGQSRACYGDQTQGDTLSAVNGIGGVDPTTGTAHGDKFTVSTENADLTFTVYHGQANQTANTELSNIAGGIEFTIQKQLGIGSTYWDTNSKLLDTAYAVVSIPITEDQQEIPEISAVVSGKLVSTYDNAGVETPNQYTLNPVWHLLDYLQSTIYGGRLASSDINFESFNATASLYDSVDGSYDYDWVTTEKTVNDNVSELLRQLDGTLNILAGKYHLSAENNDSTIADIDMSECIGGITTKDNTTKSKWNSIQATISDPAMLWSGNQVVFFNSVFKAEDNNIDKKGTVVFKHITNYYTARYWAERQMKKSRYSREIKINVPYKYLYLFPTANITFTYSRFGYTNKVFRVKSMGLRADGRVSLTLQDYDPSLYDSTRQNDNSQEQNPAVPVVRAPTNVSFLDIQSAPLTPTRDNVYGILYWVPSVSKDVLRYDVEDWIDLDGTFTVPVDQLINISGTDYNYIELHDLVPGNLYNFRVRTVTHQGRKSKWSELEHTVPANGEPSSLPAPSSLVAINEVGDSNVFTGSDLNLQWQLPNTEVGIDNYVIEVRNAANTATLGSYTVVAGTTAFNYTLANNKADYATNNASALGAYREFDVRIRAENTLGTVVSDWIYLE
jgi:hypothetical protein